MCGVLMVTIKLVAQVVGMYKWNDFMFVVLILALKLAAQVLFMR
jgi:hypothetical protein